MLFQLPKGPEGTKEGRSWKYGAYVLCVFLLGVLAALLATYLAPTPPANWNPHLSSDQSRALEALNVAECIFFGIGVVFLVTVGPYIPKVAPVIRIKVIGMYLSVGWILISWFPHIRLHAYFHEQIAIVAIDIAFHWTVAAATLFLSTFIYKFLIKVSGWHNDNKVFSRQFYRADLFHFVTIVVVVWVIMFAVVSPNYGGRMESDDKGIEAAAVLIDIVEALLHAVAQAFLIKMIFVIKKISNPAVRRRAIPTIICIWWITASWWFHSRTHSVIVGPMGALDPVDWILVEVFFHWTAIAAGGLVSYNIFGLIRMAIKASQTTWRTSGKFHPQGATAQSATLVTESDTQVEGKQEIALQDVTTTS